MKKMVFYFNSIKRGGSEIALLRYFKALKNCEEDILIYSNTEASDKDMIEEFKEIVEVYNIQKGEKYITDVAINCSIYDVDEELFNNVEAKKYVFWAQVNPFFNGRHADRKALLKYDTYLATSKYIEKCLIDAIPEIKDRVYVATPIVDCKEIIEKSNEKQDKIVKKDGTFNIISVARYSPSKGYGYNFEIAKILNENNFPFVWYSLGFVPDNRKDFYDDLQLKIKENGLEGKMVHLGVDSNPYKYVKECDLNVLFSIDEAWGLVVTEAKILNVPNVVSNVGGLVEQVQEDMDGKIYNLPETKEDYEKIAQGIMETLNNKEKYIKMKENLKGFEYDVQEIVNSMNKCFEL